MTVIRIDSDTIITVTERQPDGGFVAWFGDFDLDCMTGHGRSIVGAASDLLDTEYYHRMKKLNELVKA